MFDVFYLDRPTGLFPHEQHADSIEHAQQLSRTRFCWVVNYLADYTGFDFLWEPKPWEANQRHAWASQWQIDSGTYLIPKQGYTDTNYHKSPVITRVTGTLVYLIDHHNPETAYVQEQIGPVRAFRNTDSYLSTLKRIANSVPAGTEHVWVCSSVCDYRDFDFGWHPDPWQQELVHVFPSNNEKFGDTFYIHVPSFLKVEQPLLEYYPLNFVEFMSVPRWPMPVIKHNNDSQADAVKNTVLSSPLAVFATQDIEVNIDMAVPLWTDRMRTITSLCSGSSAVIVPRTASAQIRTQLYDYPYIKRCDVVKEPALDIVFVSNGEPNAEQHFSHLNSVTYNLENRLHRVDGVNGRIASQRAAAAVAKTNWYFFVPAKLEVALDFDWSWQPDRMQAAKHYIFHARNPVNELVYGHMAMVAYNKDLVLATQGHGLDFTMEQPHEVVPVLSGTAYYNHGAWQTWRTAFREALKLQASLPDIESQYRLEQWLTNSNEPWSQWGAEDAVEYYNEVQGDFSALMKSYEWDWLASYAFVKRGIGTETSSASV